MEDNMIAPSRIALVKRVQEAFKMFPTMSEDCKRMLNKIIHKLNTADYSTYPVDVAEEDFSEECNLELKRHNLQLDPFTVEGRAIHEAIEAHLNSGQNITLASTPYGTMISYGGNPQI